MCHLILSFLEPPSHNGFGWNDLEKRDVGTHLNVTPIVCPFGGAIAGTKRLLEKRDVGTDLNVTPIVSHLAVPSQELSDYSIRSQPGDALCIEPKFSENLVCVLSECRRGSLNATWSLL